MKKYKKVMKSKLGVFLMQLPYHRHISPVGVFVHRTFDEVRYIRHVSLIKRFKHYNTNLSG